MALPNFKRWRNGEIFNARDYVYERDIIVNELNRLSALLEGSGTPGNWTVNALAANSITMGGQTITSFEEAGTKIYYETLPSDVKADSLFIDYD